MKPSGQPALVYRARLAVLADHRPPAATTELPLSEVGPNALSRSMAEAAPRPHPRRGQQAVGEVNKTKAKLNEQPH